MVWSNLPPDAPRDTMGAALLRYRKAADVPQKVLAAMVGVSPTRIAKWEAGHPIPPGHRSRIAAILAGQGHRVPLDLRAMLSAEDGVACVTSAEGIVLDVARAGIVRSGGRQLAMIGRNVYACFHENSARVRERHLADLLRPRGVLLQVSFVDRCVIEPERHVRRLWTRVVVDGTPYRYTRDEYLDGPPAGGGLDLHIVTRDEVERAAVTAGRSPAA